ncbi:30S ribosomal subunit biogenesis factor LepA [Candidatus Xenohaliotis californiensis]|uniref:Elongation factor 4 n=1 Tax=Candidatus Xenohaliotis californiensis TaxID=84677 RepID=A0ABP0EWQ0_9RICK|nr:30S ribosomal subunit biogenesis factor LepA [Candidatus Xenohaliotis californiensis]
MTDIKKIRNFAIIAHIDHGKSTVSDRLIELYSEDLPNKMTSQLLDSMDIEKERGITIKAQTVRLNCNGYIFNLIDTPGHVDFSYEVNRSLAACEGSVLLVDASQGVEAQTLANIYHALDNNHSIIVALNKIDLPAANPSKVKSQIEDVIGISAEDAIDVSAKTGEGIEDLARAVISRLPSPSGSMDKPLRALIVDSWYDNYLGVVVLIRIIDGVISPKMEVITMSNKVKHVITQVGIFSPKKTYIDQLSAGEIGFITANIKSTTSCRVGDTITVSNGSEDALPGFKSLQSMVFCGLFPVSSDDFKELKKAVEKLHLNDAGFEFEVESSDALGYGFHCGFLGLLHLEITIERLEREFDLDLITTAPSVMYKISTKNGNELNIHNPGDMPDVTTIERVLEPTIVATIIAPQSFVGSIMQICIERRCEDFNTSYSGERAIMSCIMPLSEIVFDFYDRLKSISSGYASFNWEKGEYKEADIVKLSILINEEKVDALSLLINRDSAENRGREICKRLKELIPKHLFKIPIQAAIGGKIIARETINALRKDVTSKCYGGDVSRKRKLIEKQKKGKKKMREVGNVQVPQKVFIEALKINHNK